MATGGRTCRNRRSVYGRIGLERERTILIWIHRMGRRLGAIALLAMLVRAVVPAGYMLAEAETANGRYLTVDFCEGNNATKRVLDLETRKLIDPSEVPSSQHDSKAQHAPCVFATAAPAAPPLAAAEPVRFVVSQDVNFDVARDVRPGRGIAAPPPPSTGPPSSI